MTLPDITVEIGFEQSISQSHDGVVWEDVTSLVRTQAGVSFSRGRAVPGASPTAGSLSCTLANDNGDFTPGRSDGAYGTITTRVPIRVTGGGYDLWWGFVSDWSWVPGVEIRSSVQASDIIATAGKIRCRPWMSGRITNPPSSTLGNTSVDGGTASTSSWGATASGGDSTTASWTEYFDGGDSTEADEVDPTAYWPLNDESGSTTGVSGVGGEDLVFAGSGGTGTFGVESDCSPDNDKVVALTPASATDNQWLNANWRPTSENIGFSGWFRITDHTYSTGLCLLYGTSGGIALYAYVDTTGKIVVGEGGVTGTYGAAGAVPIGEWCHIYIERDAATATPFSSRFKVWVNGSSVTLSSGGGSVVATTLGVNTSRLAVFGQVLLTPLNGQMCHIALFPYCGGSDLASHLADRGTTQPTASERFLDLAYLTIDPPAVVSWMDTDDSATTLISAQATDNKTLLDVVSQIANTERGSIIASRDGFLMIQSKANLLHADPVLELSADTDVKISDDAFGIDDANLVSEVTVTNQPSGAQYRKTRNSDVVNSGVESDSLDVWAVEGVQAEAIATELANRDTDTPRAPKLLLSMDQMAAQGKEDTVLQLELGDLIRVTDLPSSAPSATMDFVVESITHDNVGTPGWSVTLDTSNGGLAVGWVLDDADLSILDSTTILRG